MPCFIAGNFHLTIPHRFPCGPVGRLANSTHDSGKLLETTVASTRSICGCCAGVGGNAAACAKGRHGPGGRAVSGEALQVVADKVRKRCRAGGSGGGRRRWAVEIHFSHACASSALAWRILSACRLERSWALKLATSLCERWSAGEPTEELQELIQETMCALVTRVAPITSIDSRAASVPNCPAAQLFLQILVACIETRLFKCIVSLWKISTLFKEMHTEFRILGNATRMLWHQAFDQATGA